MTIPRIWSNSRQFKTCIIQVVVIEAERGRAENLWLFKAKRRNLVRVLMSLVMTQSWLQRHPWHSTCFTSPSDTGTPRQMWWRQFIWQLAGPGPRIEKSETTVGPTPFWAGVHPSILDSYYLLQEWKNLSKNQDMWWLEIRSASVSACQRLIGKRCPFKWPVMASYNELPFRELFLKNG